MILQLNAHKLWRNIESQYPVVDNWNCLSKHMRIEMNKRIDGIYEIKFHYGDIYRLSPYDLITLDFMDDADAILYKLTYM